MKSEKSFARLQKFLISLFVVEIILGLAIVVVCEYLRLIVHSRIFQVDKHEILTVFFISKLFGLHVSFYFLCGIPLILMFNDVYTRHMGSLLKLWLLLAIETAFGSLLMIWCFADTTKYLIQGFESSLLEGIKLYPSDPLWVLIWDDMQVLLIFLFPSISFVYYILLSMTSSAVASTTTTTGCKLISQCRESISTSETSIHGYRIPVQAESSRLKRL